MWTAQVLSGLAERYGASFARSVVLISSVSGSSVGVMHYLQGIRESGDLEGRYDSVVSGAAKSSLEAIGWGVAYADFARLAMLPFIVPKYVDRGWALERTWERSLVETGGNEQNVEQATFGTWEQRIRRAVLPIPIFNATIVETGDRLLLCPVDLSLSTARDFHSFYQHSDLKS